MTDKGGAREMDLPFAISTYITLRKKSDLDDSPGRERNEQNKKDSTTIGFGSFYSDGINH